MQPEPMELSDKIAPEAIFVFYPTQRLNPNLLTIGKSTEGSIYLFK
jgi:hypothetical protein